MATFLELARMRSSVRRYDPERPVPREALERCLEAARLAPSACNAQPWRFVVADRDPLRAELARAAFGGAYAMNRFAGAAPVLVTVIRETTSYAATLGGMFRGIAFGLIDIGIACDHFTLQAAEEGLGTCWLGWFNERAVRRALDLDRRARVDIMLSVGYPLEGATRDKKRRPLETIRRYA